MILVLKRNSSPSEVQHIVDRLHDMGVTERVVYSLDRPLIATVGSAEVDLSALEAEPAVELLVPTVSDRTPAPKGRVPAAREFALGPHGAVIGAQSVAVIAGPCSVEDEARLMDTAAVVRDAGAVGLRGGAFKPRTNPYTFQGLGERALELLAQAGQAHGLAVVTEVMSPEQVDVVSAYADVLQIGTRNMHNSNLLAAVGAQSKPVLLKRGWSATLEEFLHAAEYVISAGNTQVILCERGIRTFERYVRNTLALAAVPALKQRSLLPVVVDPSQGTGVASLVGPMSRAAIACGADGLLIEVHPEPAQALTDGDQTLDFEEFRQLMIQLRALATVMGRRL